MLFLTIENPFDQFLTKNFFGQNLVKWVYDGQELHETTKNPLKPSKTFQNPSKTIKNHPKMTQNRSKLDFGHFGQLFELNLVPTNIFPESLCNFEFISALIGEAVFSWNLCRGTPYL